MICNSGDPMSLRHPVQPIPLELTFSKAQSSKLERLFCHVSVKRDVRALSFALWNSIRKCHPKWGRLYQQDSLVSTRQGSNKLACWVETALNKVSCGYLTINKKQGMGWLWSVGSITLLVSFTEYRLFYIALLQKRPIIWSNLLTKATAYQDNKVSTR